MTGSCLNITGSRQVWQLWSDGKHAQPMLPAAVAPELRTQSGSDLKQVVSSSRTTEHVFSTGDKKLVRWHLYSEFKNGTQIPAGSDWPMRR